MTVGNVQVRFDVGAPETVPRLGTPLVCLWLVREGDAQRLISGWSDGNLVHTRVVHEGPSGPLTSERADMLAAVMGDQVYERLYAYIGVQQALPDVGGALSQ